MKIEMIPIDDVKAGSRRRIDMGDIRSLADSIAGVGLLHPIVVGEDRRLIVGERRLRAFKLLERDTIPAVVSDSFEDALAALRAESEENICRLDFTPSEAVAMATALEPLERRAAKERQKEHGLTAPGKKKNTSENFSEVNDGRASAKVAAAVNMSRPTYEKAKAICEAAKDDPEQFGALKDEMDKTRRVNGVFRKLKKTKDAEAIRKKALAMKGDPNAAYDVIVADPPWHYEKRASDESHRGAIPYASMSLDEIKNYLAAQEIGIASNAILWLWTTNGHLREAFDVIDAWGFRQVTVLTWVKDKMGMGDWLRGKTEHCLMCVRGNPTVILTNQTTVLSAKAGEHSAKPDEFYAMVDSLCPGLKLELFARKERTGWSTHGLH
jgi:N6-adenosine-specific RNA methylase IME4